MKLRKFITRRRAKWAGLFASGAIVLILVVSMWLWFQFEWVTPTAIRRLDVGSGAIGGSIMTVDGEHRSYKTDGFHFMITGVGGEPLA